MSSKNHEEDSINQNQYEKELLFELDQIQNEAENLNQNTH